MRSRPAIAFLAATSWSWWPRPAADCCSGAELDGAAACRVRAQLDGPAAGPPAFAPNAFVRIGADDLVTVVLPQAEMGQGIYTALPMLVAEELEVGLDQVRVEHAPGDDRLYANPGSRLPGDGRLDLGAGVLRADAAGGGRRPHHAGRRGGTELERRSRLVPGREGHGHPRWDRAEADLRRGGRAGGEAAGARQGRAQGPEGLHPHRHAREAARHAVEGQRDGAVRHRRAAAGDEDRHGRRQPGGGRQGGGAGRAARRWRSRACARSSSWTTWSRWWPTTCGPPSRGWRRSPSAGTMDRTARSPRRTSSRGWRRHRGSRAWWPGTKATRCPAMGKPARKIEAVYQAPFLAHAAMEPLSCTVHVRQDGCEVWAGSQVQGRAQGDRGRGHRSAAGEGRVPQLPAGRGVRPAAGARLRDPGRPHRQAGRGAGQGRLDPRGRYPARRVSPLLLRPDRRRAGCAGQAGRLDSPDRRDRRFSPAGRLPRSRTGWMGMRWTGRCSCSTTSRPSRSSTCATRSRCSEPAGGEGWASPTTTS